MFNFQLLKMLSTSFVQMYPAVSSYFYQVLSLKPYFFFFLYSLVNLSPLELPNIESIWGRIGWKGEREKKRLVFKVSTFHLVLDEISLKFN